MAVTPYEPNGRLDLLITIASKIRTVAIPVEIGFVAGDYVVSTNYGLPAVVLAATVAQSFWSIFKGEYPAAVPAATYILYERLDNIFVPRDGGVLAGAGTSGGASSLGTQTTFTFKDDEQHLARLQLPETAQTSPQHLTIASIGGNAATIVAEYTDQSTVGALGQYVRSRAGLQPTRALFVSVSENFRFKRDRGL